MSIAYNDGLPWYYGLRFRDFYDGIFDVRVDFVFTKSVKE